MPAVHPPEHPVIKGLHSHADPVYPEPQQAFHVFPALFHDVVRIDLYSKFIKRPAMTGSTQGVQQ